MIIFHSLNTNLFYKAIFLIILGVALFIPLASVEAQCPPHCIENPLKQGTSDTLVGFLQSLLSVFVAFAIPIAALAIIYAGFLFVTARGSEEQLRKAKSTFFYTVIGTAVLLGAQVIISVIATTVQSL